MTKEERLKLLKQIEKDIHVCSLESTFLDDAKSCAIHSAIEELEQEPCEDAINRKDVLNKIYEVCFSKEWAKFRADYGSKGQIDYITTFIEKLPPIQPRIKVLEQEPILDKIRAEIMSKDGLEEALEIIDKYKAESEDKECI